MVGADVDVDDSSTGERIPTSGDDSDGSGAFSVVVPTGTFDLSLEPVLADRLPRRGDAPDRQLGVAVRKARLRLGSFRHPPDPARPPDLAALVVEGEVDGDRMTGTSTLKLPGNEQDSAFVATRQPGGAQ